MLRIINYLVDILKISENIEINILSKLFSINTNKVSDFLDFKIMEKYLYYRSAKGGVFVE